MALKTYFDFAEDDYRLFVGTYNNGVVANIMGALAEGICEKYMKHLIVELCRLHNGDIEGAAKQMLQRNDLVLLMDFLGNRFGFGFSAETADAMRKINGYSISACYPGANSVELTQPDIDVCFRAADGCRRETVAFLSACGSSAAGGNNGV